MALTYFYAQLFGIIMLVAGLGMVANRRSTLQVTREWLENRAVLYISGLLALLLGLVVVLTHNLWTGSALTVVVTLIGWALILKGVLRLFLPHGTIRKVFSIFAVEQTYYFIVLLVLVIGIFLTYYGFAG